MITLSKERRRERLVDERFRRPLSPAERESLEAHLVSSPTATERYRRLHLIERVTALGPERALEEPSPMEIDRIAVDLGLVEVPVQQPSWLTWLLSLRVIGMSTAAVAAAAVALFVLMPPTETINQRGVGPSRVTVSTYAVHTTGIRRASDGATVSSGHHLKFRVAAGAALSTFAAILVDESGRAYVAKLEAPAISDEPVAVPGSVALTGIAPGTVKLYLIASEDPVSVDEIDGRTVTEAELERRFGDRIVERSTLQLAEERPL